MQLTHLLQRGVGKLENIDAAHESSVFLQHGEVEEATVCEWHWRW